MYHPADVTKGRDVKALPVWPGVQRVSLHMALEVGCAESAQPQCE